MSNKKDFKFQDYVKFSVSISNVNSVNQVVKKVAFYISMMQVYCQEAYFGV